jgi:hypothetical protein
MADDSACITKDMKGLSTPRIDLPREIIKVDPGTRYFVKFIFRISLPPDAWELPFRQAYLLRVEVSAHDRHPARI